MNNKLPPQEPMVILPIGMVINEPEKTFIELETRRQKRVNAFYRSALDNIVMPEHLKDDNHE